MLWVTACDNAAGVGTDKDFNLFYITDSQCVGYIFEQFWFSSLNNFDKVLLGKKLEGDEEDNQEM